MPLHICPNSPITWVIDLIDPNSSKSLFFDCTNSGIGRDVDLPLIGTKYWMHTYQASVRVRANNGGSQVVRTEVRAPSSQDARWLLWAQYGFHSIQAGPSLVKN
jgi:hypothetical protein